MRLVIAILSLFVLVIIIWLSIPKGISVNQENLRFGKVTYGDFQEIIVASGTIEPEKSVLIDAKEGGTITEVKTEEGQIVKAGDVLVSLQNESLILDYMQRETQIVEQINNLRNTRISLEQNLRLVQDQLTDSRLAESNARRKFTSDSILKTVNGIPENEFEKSKENYYHSLNKSKVFGKRLQKDQNYQRNQFSRIDASINLMERNLEIIRSTIDEMSIKAPIGGQLNAFDLEVGQVLQRNESIGRIDVPGKFIIRALVDQHYLNRITIGQFATIEYENQDFRLQIEKVQTLVENGQFEVLLSFTDSVPENIRRGQSFQVKIEVSAQKKALMIPRGSFYQSSGGNYVYVVSPNKEQASMREVTFGKQNPEFYEVIDGLENAEEIIISTYKNFNEHESIKIETSNK